MYIFNLVPTFSPHDIIMVNGPLSIYHCVVMGGNVYLETSCSHVFMLLLYTKAYVFLYFLHVLLSFSPKMM